jgi:hypothetical protein
VWIYYRDVDIEGSIIAVEMRKGTKGSLAARLKLSRDEGKGVQWQIRLRGEMVVDGKLSEVLMQVEAYDDGRTEEQPAAGQRTVAKSQASCRTCKVPGTNLGWWQLGLNALVSQVHVHREVKLRSPAQQIAGHFYECQLISQASTWFETSKMQHWCRSDGGSAGANNPSFLILTRELWR